MNVCAPAASHCPFRLRTAALAVALAMLCVAAQAAKPAAGPDRRRVEAAVAEASAHSGAELVTRTAMVNARGRTIVRASQAWQGHRVWGSEAVLHSDRAASRMAASSLASGVVAAGHPVLTQGQALAIARKAMALQGQALVQKVDLIVFPTKYQGGVAFKWDTAAKQYTFDRAASVLSTRAKDPYVWAYDVEIYARNRIDGTRDMKYVVDARTGAVLRSDTGLKTLAPPNPPAQVDTDVATTGTGHGLFSGTVPLHTTQRADGTFQMIDRTHGSAPNPWLLAMMDNNGNPILDPNGNPISVIGLQTISETHEGTFDDFTWNSSYYWFADNATDVWGDGQQFIAYPYGYETTTNGESAAVDAHYAMGVTWDFYKNILGRDGIDGNGTSVVSEVHILGGFSEQSADNFFWTTMTQTMSFSDGTRNVATDPLSGGPAQPNPKGWIGTTALDLIGHEMTHGVTDASSGLVYSGESGGINEATSDFMGQMIEAYATRAPGADAAVPNTGTDWIVGAQVSDTLIRSMATPSRDGISPNAWYSGIEYLDTHFSGGPMNRFFYFLSQGASSDSSSQTWSRYLPGGMAGIGNDKATRIWYTAMTEWMTPVDQYADARVAAVNAAVELYGDGSAEVAAVKSAFGAINVGGPTDTPHISIRLGIAEPQGGLFNQDGGSPFERIAIVAMGTTVHLPADVQNTEDTSVTWKVGGLPGDGLNPGFRVAGGVVTADGDWTPDNIAGFHSMTVYSNADPLEFAEGAAWVIDADADGDNEFDAIDLGSVALSWGLNGNVIASHSVLRESFVDSYDVEAIRQAFRNAFGGS